MNGQTHSSHTSTYLLSHRTTRSRNNSTKRCFQENCFLSFVSNHSCNILSNSSLTNGTFVYIPSLPPVCVLQFSRFVFQFRDLFLVELTDMAWSRMTQVLVVYRVFVLTMLMKDQSKYEHPVILEMIGPTRNFQIVCGFVFKGRIRQLFQLEIQIKYFMLLLLNQDVES